MDQIKSLKSTTWGTLLFYVIWIILDSFPQVVYYVVPSTCMLKTSCLSKFIFKYYLKNCTFRPLQNVMWGDEIMSIEYKQH